MINLTDKLFNAYTSGDQIKFNSLLDMLCDTDEERKSTRIEIENKAKTEKSKTNRSKLESALKSELAIDLNSAEYWSIVDELMALGFRPIITLRVQKDELVKAIDADGKPILDANGNEVYEDQAYSFSISFSYSSDTEKANKPTNSDSEGDKINWTKKVYADFPEIKAKMEAKKANGTNLPSLHEVAISLQAKGYYDSEFVKIHDLEYDDAEQTKIKKLV